jgi:hypothetical protein
MESNTYVPDEEILILEDGEKTIYKKEEGTQIIVLRNVVVVQYKYLKEKRKLQVFISNRDLDGPRLTERVRIPEIILDSAGVEEMDIVLQEHTQYLQLIFKYSKCELKMIKVTSIENCLPSFEIEIKRLVLAELKFMDYIK